jgi:hypothetical protein
VFVDVRTPRLVQRMRGHASTAMTLVSAPTCSTDLDAVAESVAKASELARVLESKKQLYQRVFDLRT